MKTIQAPASTIWPFILALGVTLLGAGLLTAEAVSVFGMMLMLAGCAGWFREVLPRQNEVAVMAEAEEGRVHTERPVVDRIEAAPDQVRAWLPLQAHPVSAGIRGGFAGGAAMAILALAYGLWKAGSIWYPVNLLAATVYGQSVVLEHAPLAAFDAGSLAIALVLHAIISVSTGLLYGAMLPMLPGRPILLGGILGPVLWSGLLYAILPFLNPVLDRYIDWAWFAASQVAFGVAAGKVVMRVPKEMTGENVPFAIRAGVEAPGVWSDDREGEQKR